MQATAMGLLVTGDRKAKGPKTYLYQTLEGWEKQKKALVLRPKGDKQASPSLPFRALLKGLFLYG